MKPIISLLSESSNSKWERHLSKKAMEEEIKPWYHKKYPTDDIWKDLIDDANFSDVFKLILGESSVTIEGEKYTRAYELMAEDSIVRERVFSRLAEICKCSYNDIYYLWRDSRIK